MGASKKKLKRIHKAEKRVSPKAKEKAKKIRQIESRKQLLESKRKGAAAQSGAKGDTEGGETVDDLFARLGAEDDEVTDLGLSGAQAADDDSDSSAGGFCDVSDAEGDLGPGDLEVEEDTGDHETELKSLRERDPEFYKFLVSQDRALLDFKDEPEEGEEPDEQENFSAVEAAGKRSAPQGKVLTAERLQHLKESGKTSFTSCKAILNAYHTAVRSIEGRQKAAPEEEAEGEEGDEDDEGPKKGRKKKKSELARKREEKSLIRIDNEAIFSDVLEWSIANLLGIFQHHAAQEAPGGSSKKGKKAKDAKGKAARHAADGLIEPSTLPRWVRVRVLVHIYWDETFFLLNHVNAPNILEYLLRYCSTPEALCWLWPFPVLRKRFLKRCCTLWATGQSQTLRLLAFLFIRNAAAMSLRFPETKGKHKDTTPLLEQLMRTAIASFAEAAERGYSWKSLSNFRFLENCLVELFKVEDATAYRVAYVCIRQLALILRNACIAASQGAGPVHGKASAKAKAGKSSKAGGKATNPKAKSKKRLAQQQKQVQGLMSWAFVRSLYLWARIVGSVPALQPLAYPLSMITLGALKSKLTSLQHFPFVYHCFHCLNRLASTLEVFVPICAHTLKVLSIVTQAMDKAAQRGKKKSSSREVEDDEGVDAFGGKAAKTTTARAPEVEVMLRFAKGQAQESFVLELIGSSICNLLIDHLGLLSRSYSFPEVAAPVLLHLRRHSKHSRSEALRRQLKNIVTAAEQSSDHVRRCREQLTELPKERKLCNLEADATPLSRKRNQLISQRAAEERARVEAEQSGGKRKRPSKVETEKVEEEEVEKEPKKKETKAREEDTPVKKPRKLGGGKRRRREPEQAVGEDQVEEMDFSGED